MSVFLVPGKGWRYNFYLNKKRYSKGYYTTKREAQREEAQRKEAITKGIPDQQKTIEPATPTDFFELVNRRLDHVKAYNSARHYRDHVYLAKKWMKKWAGLRCLDITTDMAETYILERSKVSPDTANKDLRYLRSLFNFGIKKKLITENPTTGIDFLPVEKKIKYVPPKEDVLKVLIAAEPETQDYLYVIKETMGRMSEINQLTWDDVNFEKRYVTLYTRKKRGGHLTPRKIPMTTKLHEILSRRHSNRDKSKPWVFWHTYYSSKTGEKKEGPYTERSKIMKTLCKKAGVKYFRFHAMRHFGASVLDNANVNIGSIQRLLGHENRTTTEIYLHSIGESEREAMAVFELVTNVPDKSDTPIDTPTRFTKKIRGRLPS